MVDVKLLGGDLALDSSGNTVYVRGADERFQRALVCLTVPRGSFIYDRELGTGSLALDNKRTEVLLEEALTRCPGARARVTNRSTGAVTVQVTIDGESRTQEVQWYGNV